MICFCAVTLRRDFLPLHTPPSVRQQEESKAREREVVSRINTQVISVTCRIGTRRWVRKPGFTLRPADTCPGLGETRRVGPDRWCRSDPLTSCIIKSYMLASQERLCFTVPLPRHPAHFLSQVMCMRCRAHPSHTEF